MSSARDAILGRMKRALGTSASDGERKIAVAARLAGTPRGVIPARGQLDPKARIDLFCRMATAAAASVERVAKADRVPKSVSAYLRARNLAPEVRLGADKRLRAMPWVAERALQISYGPAEDDLEVAISHAAAGVAETGTLALFSGKENPTTLNFLPEHHIVVIDAADIDGDMESVFERVRDQYGAGAMPRTLNFITGPSRSADIEQTLLLGAHGPRALHIIVVG